MSKFFAGLPGPTSAPDANFSVDLWNTHQVTTSRLTLPNSSVLPDGNADANQTFTMEAWVKLAAIGAWQTIIGFGVSGEGPALLFTSGNKLAAYPVLIGVNNVAAIGSWMHVAVVSDPVAVASNSMRAFLYVNGSPLETVTASGRFAYGATTRLLGGDLDNECVKGKISDLRVWNTARSAAQILANYNKRLVGNEPGLKGYWKMNEGAGTTCADSTSGAATATFTSGTNIVWSADRPAFV